MPKIGIMHSGTPGEAAVYVSNFKAAVGTIVAVNWDDNHNNYGGNGRRPLFSIARALISNGTIDLVAALGGSEAMREALAVPNPRGKPIVCCCPSDRQMAAHQPYSTGVHAMTSSLENVRLQILLRDAGVQPGDTIGILLRGTRNDNAQIKRDLQAVVDDWNRAHNPANPVTLDSRDITPGVDDPATGREIEAAFQYWRSIANTSGYQANIGARGALVTSDPLFHDLRRLIVGIARNRVPKTIYQWADFVEAGGWMSHGASLLNCYTDAGHMAGHLLQGTRDNPIIHPAMTSYCPGWPNLPIIKPSPAGNEGSKSKAKAKKKKR